MEEAVVRASKVTKTVVIRASTFGKGEPLTIVDGVDVEIADGEVLGLVGQSGSGKTTLGRILLGLEKPDSGTVRFFGNNVYKMDSMQWRDFRLRAQLIFQDPFACLPPHMKVGPLLAEPLKINHMAGDREQTRKAVEDALHSVALTPTEEFASKRPGELSGGQRQRVAIARALMLKPKFVVADEPVSMLDVSVRAGILNLLRELRRAYDLSMLFITHDLSVAVYTCDRLAVMQAGVIVESGPTRELVEAPKHEYTKALLAAIPAAG
ncbi:MAG: ABC transporter ATP-binding protein [Thaumarchaeota archaeon]|nr:ABC transporter ATP-binding protein [Nitrososphaerota archaeon]